jgi:hypothetical protein
MAELNETFKALLKEAQFTNEMLGAGATQIRKANYATKGIYFQAFTSLSTGLERIGKLCLMLDHYMTHNGRFPDSNYMKNEVGHKLRLIHKKSLDIVQNRCITFRFSKNISDPIHTSIVDVISNFAEGDRYSNINLVVGSNHHGDPIAAWFNTVDTVLYEIRVSTIKKRIVEENAKQIATLMAPNSVVFHISETGEEIRNFEDASLRTGMQNAVAPYRQLYVLQIIRYWVELLTELQYKAMQLQREDIPHFSEIFAAFYNPDTYMRTRKTWEGL